MNDLAQLLKILAVIAGSVVGVVGAIVMPLLGFFYIVGWLA